MRKSCLETLIDSTEKQIQDALRPYEVEVKLLKQIPGINQTAAATVIAEIGTDMNQFPNEKHLTSWAGMAPGNNESAGKKKNTKINPGNKYLKVILIQSALAAVKNKQTYYSAFFKRLLIRVGSKKALVAVGRKILATAYFVIGGHLKYEELGATFLDERSHERKVSYYKRQLESLGKNVMLSDAEKTIAA